MNREQRPGFCGWLFPCAAGIATSLVLGGIVGCFVAAPDSPRPPDRLTPPPLPESRSVTVVHSESRAEAAAMSAAPGVELAVRNPGNPLVPASAPATNRGAVTLAWRPSPDSSVVGYRLIYGTNPGDYQWSATIAGRATTNAVLTGLMEGMRYYAACVSFDASGVESVPSNEVNFVPRHFIHLRQHSWAVEAFGVYGQTNEIKMSTNLSDWWTVMTFVGDGSLKTYLHTNQAQAWFRVETK